MMVGGGGGYTYETAQILNVKKACWEYIMLVYVSFCLFFFLNVKQGWSILSKINFKVETLYLWYIFNKLFSASRMKTCYKLADNVQKKASNDCYFIPRDEKIKLWIDFFLCCSNHCMNNKVFVDVILLIYVDFQRNKIKTGFHKSLGCLFVV